jgi:hypothetical protein
MLAVTVADTAGLPRLIGTVELRAGYAERTTLAVCCTRVGGNPPAFEAELVRPERRADDAVCSLADLRASQDGL